MFFLFVIAIMLIGANVVVALATARELDRLKKELAKQGQVKHDMRQKLEEAQSYRKSVEGTRDLLKRTQERKQKQIQQLVDELERLKKEVGIEHEIATNEPVEQKPVDSDDTAGEGEKSAGKKIKTRIPIGL